MCRFRDGNMPEPGKRRQSVLEDFGSEEKEIGFELIDETETYKKKEKERRRRRNRGEEEKIE